MEYFLTVALVLYFFFWIYNYSDIFIWTRAKVNYYSSLLIVRGGFWGKLAKKLIYVTQCPICFAFWVVMIDMVFRIGIFSLSPFGLFVVPILHLFIYLIFKKLNHVGIISNS